MKISLVYDAIYPYIKGGGEKRYYEIAQRLSAKGHEVHIYGQKLWSGDKIIKKEGIFYHGIAKSSSLYTQERKRSIKEAIMFGFCSLKMVKEDFDIIDCCGFPYFSLFSCKLAAKIKGKPFYSTWHEVWGKKYWKSYLGNLGIFGYLIERITSKLPDKIISVSDLTTKKLVEELNVPRNKIITIPNGINLREIKDIRKSKKKSDIIFIGRLLTHKNVNILIKSISMLRKSNKNVKAIIIDNIKLLAKSLNLEKNVIFKGFIKQDEVYSLMKSSKVFVLPSEREGFGIVAIEAFACGIPVVTVNHKGNAAQFLIKPGKNGFVSDLNEESLAQNMEKALKQSRKMKSACLKDAEEYDWNKIINKLEGIYQ